MDAAGCKLQFLKVSDFSIIPSKCNINGSAIMILNIISLFLSIILMILYSRQLMKLLLSKFQFTSKELFLSCFIFQLVAVCTYDIAMLINPEKYCIGNSIFITAMMSFSYGSVYLGFLMYLSIIQNYITLDIDNLISVRSKIYIKNLFQTAFWDKRMYLFGITIAIVIIPMFGLALHHKFYRIVGKVFFCLNASWLVLYAIFQFPILYSLISEIDKNIILIDNEKVVATDSSCLKKINKKLKSVFICTCFVICIIFFLYIVFGTVDYLQRQSVYVTLVSTTLIHVITLSMMSTIPTNRVYDVSILAVPQQTSQCTLTVKSIRFQVINIENPV